MMHPISDMIQTAEIGYNANNTGAGFLLTPQYGTNPQLGKQPLGKNQGINSVVFPMDSTRSLNYLNMYAATAALYGMQEIPGMASPQGGHTANNALSQALLAHQRLNGYTFVQNPGSPLGTREMPYVTPPVIPMPATVDAAKILQQMDYNANLKGMCDFSSKFAESIALEKAVENGKMGSFGELVKPGKQLTKRKVCQEVDCGKFGYGATTSCPHGGGIKCEFLGCPKSSQGNTKRCKSHGGGRRCKHKGCHKAAQDSTEFCKGHGGGRRCNFPICHKSARGKTGYCVAHGGGKRCSIDMCTKSAAGSTNFCIAHGGGKRCNYPECKKSALGATKFCFAHGGGKRCMHENCKKAARGSTKFCVQHGGGRRCKASGCNKGAQGATYFCVKHGGKRNIARKTPQISHAQFLANAVGQLAR